MCSDDECSLCGDLLVIIEGKGNVLAIARKYVHGCGS
jgi:hypothetical protein